MRFRNSNPKIGDVASLGSEIFGLAILSLFFSILPLGGHVVPPEKLHPVAESYRRLSFLLNLNPVLWDQVMAEVEVIAAGTGKANPEKGRELLSRLASLIRPFLKSGLELPGPEERRATAEEVFRHCTGAVAELLATHLDIAMENLGEYATALPALATARQLWFSFAHEIKYSDPTAFSKLGKAWLELTSSLGTPGILNIGAMEVDRERFSRFAEKIKEYVLENYAAPSLTPSLKKLAPLPVRSETFAWNRPIPVKLPPGSNINKQLPRPRQLLNMAERGVDEGETVLIALGDMAFDSPYVFGEPARSLQISCNTCHNKSITNPHLLIPGLSAKSGGIDVSNSFFAGHANNGHFDALDIPDLRGIRFTAPYGRNGRFDSLREFVRNVIVNEFNGPEPEPTILDGLLAYMFEFDFLANPKLRADGKLNERASEAARRGEKIFHRTFENMGNRSCTTCHIPSANFLDHKQHDIGSVRGAEPYSRDRSLDTPTLLSAKFTAPYFHDGSRPTLRSVNVWFNDQFELGLAEQEIDDLTAYVETVADGVEPYEDTIHTLEAEMEEFRFFLSAYEFLKEIGKHTLISITFQTISKEIHAHKWDIQNTDYLPILNLLAELMESAYAANLLGQFENVDAMVGEYRSLYEEYAEFLK